MKKKYIIPNVCVIEINPLEIISTSNKYGPNSETIDIDLNGNSEEDIVAPPPPSSKSHLFDDVW